MKKRQKSEWATREQVFEAKCYADLNKMYGDLQYLLERCEEVHPSVELRIELHDSVDRLETAIKCLRKVMRNERN